ncbi:hypothetical protein ACFYV5_17250 [Streptomyces sp. NPDC003035]|uniref:hypothetical protein n=1 Tax=Streptomyces sp. NPDC003035 TaxID=3364676 RepID=UPI0036B728A5
MSGGGGEAGKDLATAGLNEVTNGLTLALGELKELGMDSMAAEGRGFGEIALSGLELGHEGLTGTFSSFCERWEWGVRSLISEGNMFAVATGLSAGKYHEAEQYLEGTFKIVANAAIGNPYASEDEVTKQGWGDIATSGYLGGVDYSKESFDEARANSAQGWKDAGRDLATSQTVGLPGLGPQNAASVAGVTDAQYEAALDDMFGPSAEERAAAAQQQQQQQGVPPQQQRGDQG